MKDDYDDERDIERMLKDAQVGPSERVKRSVLDGYARAFKGERVVEKRIGMLRRPIPLYLFLLSMITVAGLSFYSAEQMFRPPAGFAPLQESVQGQDSTAAESLTWTAAQRDLL
ncbi:MAG: hypothetical protein HY770_08460 [Chitinivibrionia bacterium]|nr:hypothetical protein [Chitinivibrionia bacterium]